MCGRYQSITRPAEMADLFKTGPNIPNTAPNWNAAPTQSLPVVRFNPESRNRQLDNLRWGLVPIWSKDLKTGFKAINARCETVTDLGMFRDAFKSRRCLVPADGFYEWKAIEGGKQPYSFAMADRSVFAFAGLWERWKDSASGEIVRTFTIITTAANELVSSVHTRMPVILPYEHHARWLGEVDTDATDLVKLLVPFPAERMKSWPVSLDVGNVKNNHSGLIEELNSE